MPPRSVLLAAAMLADVARTIAPGKTDPHGPLAPSLLVLTVVTGLVDAVSYLRLGHVFVANMTGNVVFLGFGLAGAREVSIASSALATFGFVIGAIVGGRFGVRFDAHRGHLLAVAIFVKVAIIAIAVVVAVVAGAQLDDFRRYVLVALLAVAMGLQTASARRVALADLTTTVLTQTLTGLAADSWLAGGSAPRAGRRFLSIVTMLFGAALGGVLVMYVSIAAALGTALILLAVTGACIVKASTPDAHWAAPPP